MSHEVIAVTLRRYQLQQYLRVCTEQLKEGQVMGYSYFKLQHEEPVKQFRAVEITGSLLVERSTKIHFNQVLLLHADSDTLEFAEKNLAKFVSNAIMIKKMAVRSEAPVAAAGDLTDGIVPLLESIVMSPEKNLLHLLTASLKKAILSIALTRYHANKEMICNVLGLSGSQLDDELRSSGFDLIVDQERE